MSLKSFMSNYEFQVAFKIEAVSLRPKEKQRNDSYTPSIPFNFESREGKVLFYDKLPRSFYSKPSERYEELKEQVILKNINQYLAEIVNADDLANPYFKLVILESVVNAMES